MGIAREALVQRGEFFVHEDNGHVQVLDVWRRGPVEQGNDVGRSAKAQMARFSTGKHVRSMLDQNRNAESILLRGHHVALDETVELR